MYQNHYFCECESQRVSVCMRVNMHKIIMIAQLQNNLQVLCKITGQPTITIMHNSPCTFIHGQVELII